MSVKLKSKYVYDQNVRLLTFIYFSHDRLKIN